jgi:hypothetical protein
MILIRKREAMKLTVVPAQITTVEDRIAGNLSVSQMLLFALPVFGGSLLYAILPPFMGSAPYKLVVMTVLAVVCGISAIRIKGKIILLWVVVLLRYRLRPHYYVFMKQSVYGRESDHLTQDSEPSEETVLVASPLQRNISLSIAEQARASYVLDHPTTNVSFKAKKGGLYVSITEAPEES